MSNLSMFSREITFVGLPSFGSASNPSALSANRADVLAATGAVSAVAIRVSASGNGCGDDNSMRVAVAANMPLVDANSRSGVTLSFIPS